MRNAPSVIYPVGRCRIHAVLLWVLGLTALALLLGWRAGSVAPSGLQQWAFWIGTGFWGGWVVWGAWNWRVSPCGSLHWDAFAPPASLMPADGQGAWCWVETGASDSARLDGIEVAIDLQHLALLRLTETGNRTRWAWVERGRDPSRWNDLRRALRSTAG
jgi:hypothetical protein